MSQCECEKAGEPRDIIDLYTPLYQACGGRLYRLHIESDANAILMGDGVSVEVRVNSLERALLANTTTYFADTIAGRDAVAPLTAGDRCYVFDASADATVPYGSAMYIWLPSRKWRKLYNGDSPIDAVNLAKPGGGLGVEDNRLYVKVDDLLGFALKKDAGKIAVDASRLTGAGLELDSQGRLSVKVGALPEAQLAELAGKLIAAGGGLKSENGKLAVDAADIIKSDGGLKASGGKLAVDFGQIPAADLASLAGSLAKPGGGLTAGANGGLAVDFASMPASTLRPMVMSMIKTGGGLSVDSQGRIYFDAQSMDTSVFEAMMKKLRLPLWLDANLMVNVNKNHSAAADTLIEGRGTASLPFKSIQAAVNYVCDNFNLGKFNTTINIAAGIYDESVTLGDYTTNTGTITLLGEDTGAENLSTIIRRTNQHCIYVTGKNTFILKNIKMYGLVNAETGRFGTVLNTVAGSQVILDRFELQIDYSGELAGKNHRPFCIYGNMNIRNSTSGNSRIKINNYSAGMENLFRLCGQITMEGGNEGFAEILCSGAASKFMAVIGGTFLRNTAVAHPMLFSGTGFTGKRYEVGRGGKCDVAGVGPDFFPGDTAGTVDANTYSWYA